MLIRLGYVAISRNLDLTTSSTYSYTNFSKDNNYEKLDRIIKSNLSALKKVLLYNVKNSIHFYRMSSKLIPLVTHPKVNFNYTSNYKKHYKELSKIIKDNNLRVDFHPDQFTILNSINDSVVSDSIDNLIYHYNLLDMMDIKRKVIILHVGSGALGKDESIKRFINNFNTLPLYLKESIVLENDDKVFDASDVISICKILHIPMVLDIHHDRCNPSNFSYEDIFNTWDITPKIHYSTPKSKLKNEFRSHNEYIDVDEFIEFINSIKHLNFDIDIMLEAKGKDDALFKLVSDLKLKTNYEFIDESSFRVE
ncbi:MAG: UV DNA damage repair endonuclease UvsE [Bacilli bacterium]|nr:UV DNA damage repair endonuclease UvsE [Bacilli bacterium]